MLIEDKFIYVSLPRRGSTSFHYSCILHNFDIKLWQSHVEIQNSKIDFTSINDSDIMKDYNLHLVGDVLWGFNNTENIDIIITGNPTSYMVLEDYMHYMYDIALNKYNILIDISWVNIKPDDIVYTPDLNFSYDNDFLRIGYVRKQIGEEHEELDLRINPLFSAQGDYLIKGNFKNINFKESFINNIFYYIS